MRLLVNFYRGRLYPRPEPDSELAKEIDSFLSYKVKDHDYMKLPYEWDGIKHLYNRFKGSFPIGFTNTVIEILEMHKRDAEIIDHRTTPLPIPMSESMPFEPRPYQSVIIRKAIATDGGIIESPAGSGKTKMAMEITRRLGYRSLFVVHTKDLLRQAKQTHEEFFDQEIGQIGMGKIDVRNHTIATIQTLAKIVSENIKIDHEIKDYGVDTSPDRTKVDKPRRIKIQKALERAGVIHFDECHHIPARRFFSFASHSCPIKYKYGWSATPWRDDQQDTLIEAICGPKIMALNSSNLIAQGYLVIPRIQFINIPRKFSSIQDDGSTKEINSYILKGTYHEVYRACVTRNVLSNNIIVEETLRFLRDGKSILILVKHVEHGFRLRKLLRTKIKANRVKFVAAKGSEIIDGIKEKNDDRESSIRIFRERKLPVLIGTSLADEGLDIPHLNVVILAGRGKSSTRFKQRVGRAQRIFDNKKYCDIVDFMDQAPFLNRQARERKRMASTENAWIILESEDN